MRSLGVFAFVLGLAAAPVRAAEHAEDHREETAREAFAAGRYDDALAIYIKLYAERPHPTFLRNIGRCYQNLGDADRAISSFREYLRQAQDLAPNQRALVERYIAEMEQLKRKREPTVTPAPEAPPPRLAQARPRTPPEPEAATSGPVLAPGPPARDNPDENPPVTARGPARYIIAAGSVAALGVGGYFGWRAISWRKDSDRQCVGGCTKEGVSLNDQAKTAARAADITIGLGLVGAGIAAYLFLTAPSEGEAASGTVAQGHLRLAPEIGAHQAALQLEGAW